MAITQYAGNRFTGLVVDTKPDNLPDGALFTELDGDKITYIREGGQWVEYIGETIEAVNSIEIEDGEIQLVGDEESPGNNKVYGTDGSGVKGWKDDPAGGGGGGGITAISNIGSTGSNQTINFNTHRLAKATITGDIQITLSDGSSSTDTAQGTIVLTQDGTGGREVTDWNGNVLFPGGIEPILSASSGAIDTLHFEWDGANWLFVNMTTDQS